MYKLTADPTIVINEDTNEIIPQGSRHWDDYETWLSDGNTPDPIYSLDDHKAWKIQQMNDACKSEIYLGFNSNATGTWLHYPAEDLDQQNLSASVLDSVLAVQANETSWSTPFWCANSTNTWSYLSHNTTQIQQVGRDGKAQILACLQQKATLATQINAMTDYDQITNVTWISPVGSNQPDANGYNLPTT
jgi:hypothetical protein